MDYAFFCVFSAMTPARYQTICIYILFAFVVSCNLASEKIFELKPANDAIYFFTVETEESETRDIISYLATTHRFEFTLQMQKRVDSLQTFNILIQRISVTRPEIVAEPGKNGGVIARSTDRVIKLTTDVAPHDPGIINATWHAVVPRLVGDSMKVTINEFGGVNNVWGYETIRNKIVAATGEDPRNISHLIREYVGPEAITDLMNGLFFYLPGKPINPRDQWVKNVEFIQRAPVKYSHNITVQSIHEDTVHLSVRTIVSARLGQGKLIVEGELTGEITASISSGMLLNMDLTENSETHTDAYDVKKKRIFRASAHQSPAR